jgi:hypothetical protein
MAKTSLFIISLVVFIMILAGGIGSLMGEMNTQYSPGGYNSSSIEVYNKLDELTTKTARIENKSKELEGESGAFDPLKGFFEGSYNAIVISTESLDVFNSMATSAFDDLGINNADIYKQGILVIVIVVVFVGIIISTIVKRES